MLEVAEVVLLMVPYKEQAEQVVAVQVVVKVQIELEQLEQLILAEVVVEVHNLLTKLLREVQVLLF